MSQVPIVWLGYADDTHGQSFRVYSTGQAFDSRNSRDPTYVRCEDGRWRSHDGSKVTFDGTFQHNAEKLFKEWLRALIEAP